MKFKLEIDVRKVEGPTQDHEAIKQALAEEIEQLTLDVDDGEHDLISVYEVHSVGW